MFVIYFFDITIQLRHCWFFIVIGYELSIRCSTHMIAHSALTFLQRKTLYLALWPSPSSVAFGLASQWKEVQTVI